MKTENNRRRVPARKAAWVLFALFALILLVVAGAGTLQKLSGVLLLKKPEGGARVLLLSQQEDRAWLVCSGPDHAALLRLEAASGKVQARRELEHPLMGAALRGERLFLWEDNCPETGLYVFAADSLEELSRQTLNWNPLELIDFDCDGAGRFYGVLADDPGILQVWEPSGTESGINLPGPADFLAVDDRDGLWVCVEGTLYLSEDGGKTLREIAGGEAPAVVLSHELWLDRGGFLRRRTETGAETLYRLPEQEYAPHFFCLDRENCLILSDGSSTVWKYGPAGASMGSCRTEGVVAAVCGSGAVTETETEIFYVPLRFQTAVPSLSPSPGPESSAPTEEAPVRMEGELLIVPAGFTAAELRELMKPETADIRDTAGNAVTRGAIATGMTVNRWTAVVLGDCDGTGTVTGADVRCALALSLDNRAENNAFRRAVDLDEDGRITAADLVLLSRMANGEK